MSGLKFNVNSSFLSYTLDKSDYSLIKDDINSAFTNTEDRITLMERVKSFDAKAKKEAFPIVKEIVIKYIGKSNVFTETQIEQITIEFLEDVLMYSVITGLYHKGLKNEITDLHVDGFNDIYYRDLRGDLIDTDLRFRDQSHLIDFIVRNTDNINVKFNRTNVTISVDNDGVRMSALHPIVVIDGGDLSMRFHKKVVFTFDEYLENGTISPELSDFYKKLLKTNESIFVYGQTGAGKTSTINSLICQYPRNSKGRSIERHALIADTQESSLKKKDPKLRIIETFERNAGDSIYNVHDALKAMLRHDIKFIHFNEVRDVELKTLLNSWASGHSGISGIHGEEFVATINRMKMILGNAGIEPKQAELLIQSTCHVFLHCASVDKKRVHRAIFLLNGFTNGNPDYVTLAEYKNSEFHFYPERYTERLKNSLSKNNLKVGV